MATVEELHERGARFVHGLSANAPHWHHYQVTVGTVMKQTQGWHKTEQPAREEAMELAEEMLTEQGR